MTGSALKNTMEEPACTVKAKGTKRSSGIGGIKKLSCLLWNICNMLLAQGKWVRCFPQEPLHPGRGRGRAPADGCWGCLSVQKTGNEKSVPPSTADLLMTDSSPLRPQAQRAAGALPPWAVSAPELSLLSRAECRLPWHLHGLDLALGYKSMIW